MVNGSWLTGNLSVSSNIPTLASRSSRRCCAVVLLAESPKARARRARSQRRDPSSQGQRTEPASRAGVVTAHVFNLHGSCSLSSSRYMVRSERNGTMIEKTRVVVLEPELTRGRGALMLLLQSSSHCSCCTTLCCQLDPVSSSLSCLKRSV